MVSSMDNTDKKKILVLVEGAKTDVVLMEKLFSTYRIDVQYEIVSYCTNIYTLYQEMFRDGVDGFDEIDILQVLKAREKDVGKKKIFDAKYTDILLIFDLDPQDPQFDAQHIQLMQKYFHESSDMGKLYLNYPMVEAFYHMKSIPDVEYSGRTASLSELKQKTYKLRVQQETRGHDYRKFAATKKDCTIVILQNISKALSLSAGKTVKWEDITNTINTIDLSTVLNQQLLQLKNHGFIYVLCTCGFYIADFNPQLLLSDVTIGS
jgi:hypothetical protein